MNKKILIIFFITILGTLSGCLEIPIGYTPSSKLSIIDYTKKYDITFSIDYLSDGDISIGRASHAQYIEYLQEYL